ncbi:hypothetical protein PPERSA_11312 [Pseudocohnilembus persalinus]|uniref:GOLD domain-containing protein n=1 Tax=Pseudocohnilembus persalinus TaxID=266149 RepID=A0A0V0QPQ5_PSEPJ|nr:hypothetical protein PPERSA_11312 [Pseudocohnilembus persalinus]|eukprot:KRX04188.1 hypothetical protein PPERSA_11312 [Pseudocohnilembus persalinus]
MKKVLLVLLSIVYIVQGIEFQYEMPSWKKNLCFGDSLGENINVFLELNMLDESEPNVSVKITDPKNEHLYLEPHKKIAFAFTTELEGEYEICFQKNQTNVSNFNLVYKTGVEANDYSELTGKDDIKPIEYYAQKMQDQVEVIKNEMKMLFNYSDKKSANIQDMSFRIIGFSVITLAMLVLLAIFQVQYLKQFFKKKKLI